MSNKNNSKAKKKRSQSLLSGRRGIVLVVLLAVMILIVNIITFSYSWFEPESIKGTGMTYHADVAVRSENCAIGSSYYAVDTNGKKDYDGHTVGNTYDVPAGETKYFKTVITNSAATPTNVSLYTNFAAPASGESYGVGVAYPSNSYHKITSSMNDYYIIRNAYIEAAQDVNHPGELEVEWFIKNTGESAVTVSFNTLYLMYS